MLYKFLKYHWQANQHKWSSSKCLVATIYMATVLNLFTTSINKTNTHKPFTAHGKIDLTILAQSMFPWY